MRARRLVWLLAALCVATAGVSAAPLPAGTIDVGNGLELAFYRQGVNPLPGAPSYDWWYGCSPTSAGMLMGYYDNNGYAGLYYTNLVPGGSAELETFVGPPTGSAALANNAIASARHISDYYTGPFGASGDDVVGAPTGSLNCLADFMGTSQDAAGNSNGSTTFWYWTSSGNPTAYRFTSDDAVAGGVTTSSGMYGVGEYVQYSGYDYVNPTPDPLNTSSPQPVGSRDDRLYNQYIDTQAAGGFSYQDYVNEIDAGRGVLVHIEEHTMFGYGYVAGAPIISVYDTWAPSGQNPGTLTWGGLYGTAQRQHYGVTVLELTGGDEGTVPELEIAWGGPNGPDHIEGLVCQRHEIWAHVDWLGHEGELFDIDMASVHWSISGGLDEIDWAPGIHDPHAVSEWFLWATVHLDPDLPYCTILAVDADIASYDLFGDSRERWSNIITVHVVPEPTTLALLAGGGLMALVRRRRK